MNNSNPVIDFLTISVHWFTNILCPLDISLYVLVLYVTLTKSTDSMRIYKYYTVTSHKRNTPICMTTKRSSRPAFVPENPMVTSHPKLAPQTANANKHYGSIIRGLGFSFLAFLMTIGAASVECSLQYRMFMISSIRRPSFKYTQLLIIQCCIPIFWSTIIVLTSVLANVDYSHCRNFYKEKFPESMSLFPATDESMTCYTVGTSLFLAMHTISVLCYMIVLVTEATVIIYKCYCILSIESVTMSERVRHSHIRAIHCLIGQFLGPVLILCPALITGGMAALGVRTLPYTSPYRLFVSRLFGRLKGQGIPLTSNTITPRNNVSFLTKERRRDTVC